MSKKTKICLKCKKRKSIRDFYKRKDRKGGLTSWCKSCKKKQTSSWKKKNPRRNTENSKKYYRNNKNKVKKYQHDNREKINKQTKERWLKYPEKCRKKALRPLAKELGIPVDALYKIYKRLFKEQEGCCAICGRHQSEFKHALAIDHNHKTGKIRKLLCVRCNTKLGHLEDLKFIERADIYLKNNE